MSYVVIFAIIGVIVSGLIGHYYRLRSNGEGIGQFFIDMKNPMWVFGSGAGYLVYKGYEVINYGDKKSDIIKDYITKVYLSSSTPKNFRDDLLNGGSLTVDEFGDTIATVKLSSKYSEEYFSLISDSLVNISLEFMGSKEFNFKSLGLDKNNIYWEFIFSDKTVKMLGMF